MKIGVLTFHKCINYGSYWQAKCLAEGLRARGHDVLILDHDATTINLAEWKCAYRPTLPTPVDQSDYPLYREKIKQFFRAFELLPLSPKFNINQPQGMGDYDLVVVGSDEVWNLSHPWYGKLPIFFGEGIAAKRLISYAASFGNYSAWNGLDPYWIEKFKQFDSLSVRDENAQAILKNTLGFMPEIVLDPCLQFPTKIEERSYERLQEPYIALYGHNFSPHFVTEMCKWSRRKNLPIISIGYRNDWADKQWISAGPYEFAYFMGRAEAIITNFFHGCVFALKNKKPFICEVSPYRSTKLLCLLDILSGKHHIANSETTTATFERVLSEPLEEKIINKIEQLSEISNAFIDRALQ
ncbi:polysaccharide pyruvyl transferase family protein [Legionella jordanis]|uniref:polysaccharide pyruvyl transferase family protein n=1 Tax=Legionella jordanis TaxID=456 RepID=UPI000EFFD0AE|nr:polysaccharide pyruvyl transferase family protein [Legionella jordanis]RMX19080.1 polysaccharide pyruvyl transferase family protein [Legionella jordanis]HAT8714807.1 polysaccharide pyruvyl transferase family protein [Legionella jordanis]